MTYRIEEMGEPLAFSTRGRDVTEEETEVQR